MLLWFMFVLYIILDVYVFLRMLHWLKLAHPFFIHMYTQIILLITYLLFASTLILGALLPRCNFQIFLKKLSNYWLGTFIYILFFILLADILVLILKLINRKKEIPILNQMRGIYIIGIAVILLSIAFSTYGFIHARKIKPVTYSVSVSKEVPDKKNLRIALVGDLHIGYSIGSDMIQKMTDIINKGNADVVIIAGDIFDNDFDSIDNPEKLESILSEIKSTYGTYAVYGNHDVTATLVGGFSVTDSKNAYRDPRMDEFLKASNIDVLTDDTVSIADDSIYLVGRLDEEHAGDGTSNRMSINKLTKNLDFTKPVIVISHEPSELEETAAAGTDILLSGHTHAGQFFPLNIVQPFKWENFHGMIQKNSMYSFVTSGVGIYGPYMRVLTNGEVMFIDVKFN